MGADRDTGGELRTFARPELLRAAGQAAERVWLCSPFVTRPIAEELVEAAAHEGIDRRLLTALVAGSVRVRALDPHALAVLAAAGWEVRSIRNLHAKVSIIDRSWGLVGSGNLTNAGLGSTDKGNLELGVILDRSQIGAASSIYEGWWKRAAPVTDADIEKFAALPKVPSKSGAEDGVGPALEIADPADIEELLGAEDPNRRYWVKANYHRRNAEGRGWWHRRWISDWRQASYNPGDLILLYLGAKFDGPRRCPAIVRVVGKSRFDPEFVAANGDPEAVERWPYVTDIECVFEVQVDDGVPLDVFDVGASGLQGGYKELSRTQFETAAEYLRAAASTPFKAG